MNIVRLGNAKIKCHKCGEELGENAVQKYLYEAIMRLQIGHEFIFVAGTSKLPLYESIIGLLAPFGIGEKKRNEVKEEDGKKYMHILVGR